MLFIKELNPELHNQKDSICVKLFRPLYATLPCEYIVIRVS